MITMKGTRIWPNEHGWLEPGEMCKPATYGRATALEAQGKRAGWWEVTAPDGSTGVLNPELHRVEEHEDGTITVHPSLDFSRRKPGGWHGWLKCGEFISC